MDPISHAVIGSAVAGLLPPGTEPAVVLGILLGAEAPDIDFVVRYWRGEAGYLRAHRGPTHGILSLILASALIAGALQWISAGTPFLTLFWWSLAGCLSHVLFDIGNDYGTQALWPFSNRRVALDVIPIVDPWILAIIGVGWLSHWIVPGHRAAIFTGVWAALGAHVLLRFWLHSRAVRVVTRHFAGTKVASGLIPCGDGWLDQRITVHPSLLSLNCWRYVVQSEGCYLTGQVWAMEGRVGSPTSSRNDSDAVVQASLQSPLVSTFVRWSRRPRAESKPQDGLILVTWTEARYERYGYSPFRAYAWLDRELSLVDEGFGPDRMSGISRELLVKALREEMGREV